MPPSMYLLSTGEKNMGAADVLRRAFHVGISVKRAIQSYFKTQTGRVEESKVVVFLVGQRQAIVSHEFQLHGEIISLDGGDHQSGIFDLAHGLLSNLLLHKRLQDGGIKWSCPAVKDKIFKPKIDVLTFSQAFSCK